MRLPSHPLSPPAFMSHRHALFAPTFFFYYPYSVPPSHSHPTVTTAHCHFPFHSPDFYPGQRCRDSPWFPPRRLLFFSCSPRLSTFDLTPGYLRPFTRCCGFLTSSLIQGARSHILRIPLLFLVIAPQVTSGLNTFLGTRKSDRQLPPDCNTIGRSKDPLHLITLLFCLRSPPYSQGQGCRYFPPFGFILLPRGAVGPSDACLTEDS